MPKLNQATAKEVRSAGLPDDFTPVDESQYVAKLEAVTALPAKEKGKFPQWQVAWELVEDVLDGGTGDQHKGRKVMDWYSLSDQPYPRQRMNELFAAFGVEPDTDTDELLGSEALITVVVEVAQQGKRQGQKVNKVVAVHDVGTIEDSTD